MNAAAMLVQAREENGLSQHEAAKVVGCSQSSLSRWESGARDPGIGRLTEVLGSLGFRLNVELEADA